jgi:hypothetical protein
VQFDEKWSFVAKKEKHCRPDGPLAGEEGDNRGQAAFGPGHRLVARVVPGKRTETQAQLSVQDFPGRTGGRLMDLMTSDEYPP